MPYLTSQTRWSWGQSGTISPFPAAALELSVQADSRAGILAADMPLKRPARDGCCQVKDGVKCLVDGIELRIPPICGVRCGTTRSHPPLLPISHCCLPSPPCLEIKVGKSKSFSPRLLLCLSAADINTEMADISFEWILITPLRV